MKLVVPSVEHVPSYLAALESRWTFDSFGGSNIPTSASQPPNILAKKPLFALAAALSAAVHEHRWFLGIPRRTSFL